MKSGPALGTFQREEQQRGALPAHCMRKRETEPSGCRSPLPQAAREREFACKAFYMHKSLTSLLQNRRTKFLAHLQMRKLKLRGGTQSSCEARSRWISKACLLVLSSGKPLLKLSIAAWSSPVPPSSRWSAGYREPFPASQPWQSE